MISKTHALAITDIDNACLVGAYDPFDKASESFCEKWKIKKFDTIDEILSSEDIDIISICTPSGTHADLAVAALEKGKHVIVEKPMALTPADCDRVVNAQIKSGKKCIVISQLRFSETSKKVVKAIADGKLGKLLECNIDMKYHRDEEYYSSSNWRGTWAMDGGGALMNQGIHGIDLLLYYMGDVKSVYGICRTMRHDIEVEDTAVAAVEFKNGAIGVIQGTTSVSPGYPRQFTLCGTEGSIVIEEDSILKWDIPNEVVITQAAENNSFADPGAISFNCHKAQIQNLINHLTNGEEILIDANEGKRSVELICAIYQSSKTGKKIDF